MTKKIHLQPEAGLLRFGPMQVVAHVSEVSVCAEPEAKRAAFVSYVGITIKMLQAKLDQFAADFASSPCHALQWSDSTFAHAAEQDVYLRVAKSLENGTLLENILKFATEEALNAARFPHNSTSATANRMAQCHGAAWGKLATELPQWIGAKS